MFAGQLLSPSDRVAITPGVGLDISAVTESDSGNYTCVAVGNEATAEATIQLSVTGPLISCAGECVLLAVSTTVAAPLLPMALQE